MHLAARIVFLSGAASLFVAMGFMYVAAVRESMKGTALGFRLIYRLLKGTICNGARILVVTAMSLNILGFILLIVGVFLNRSYSQ